jgi:hypothetical protein
MNTHFALLAIYGDVNIPLEKVLHGILRPKPQTRRRSREQAGIACACLSPGSNKSQWFMDAASWLRTSIRRRFRPSRSGEL